MPKKKITALAEPIGDDRFAHIHPLLRELAIRVDQIEVDPLNARAHDARNMDAVTRSLARWGQRQPLVVQRRGEGRLRLVAGHARLAAAQQLGWRWVATIEVDDSDTEAAAYALADNRTSELASWNDLALARVLCELRAEDAFGATGFDAGELDALLASLTPEEVERLEEAQREEGEALAAALEDLDGEPEQGPELDDPSAQAPARVVWGVAPGQLWEVAEGALILSIDVGEGASDEDVALAERALDKLAGLGVGLVQVGDEGER